LLACFRRFRAGTMRKPWVRVALVGAVARPPAVATPAAPSRAAAPRKEGRKAVVKRTQPAEPWAVAVAMVAPRRVATAAERWLPAVAAVQAEARER
jgi:hypothetical protein